MKIHHLFSPRAMAEGRLVGLGCEASRCLLGGARPADVIRLLDDMMALHVQITFGRAA